MNNYITQTQFQDLMNLAFRKGMASLKFRQLSKLMDEVPQTFHSWFSPKRGLRLTQENYDKLVKKLNKLPDVLDE